MPRMNINGKPITSTRIYIYKEQQEFLHQTLAGNLTLVWNMLAQDLVRRLQEDRAGTLGKIYARTLSIEDILPKDKDNEPTA